MGEPGAVNYYQSDKKRCIVLIQSTYICFAPEFILKSCLINLTNIFKSFPVHLKKNKETIKISMQEDVQVYEFGAHT